MRCIKKTGGVKEMGGFYEGLIGEGDVLAVQRTFMGSAINIMKKHKSYFLIFREYTHRDISLKNSISYGSSGQTATGKRLVNGSSNLDLGT